jgi:hypothetical protein
MSRNRWARVAKKARDQLNINYTLALKCCRDVYELPDFDERMSKLHAEGLSYPDAMVKLIEEEFEFLDEEG